jgi:cathepsin D
LPPLPLRKQRQSNDSQIGGPVYEDVVSLIGTKLSVPLQPLGVVTVPVSPPAFPNDGLVGFAGPDSSALNATSWFQSLCSQGTLDACRFGLAFETDNTGVQYFGKVEANRFDGKLSVAPLFNGEQWTLFGDVAFNGTVIEKDVMIVTDSGTTTIFGLVQRQIVLLQIEDQNLR